MGFIMTTLSWEEGLPCVPWQPPSRGTSVSSYWREGEVPFQLIPSSVTSTSHSPKSPTLSSTDGVLNSRVRILGEVPVEQRVENLNKFKSEEGDSPTLVCTDLAARGLDLDVDHVIMFDFPLNSIDYLHRTGRTARMGAKGKVTSLVAKKDLLLATRIEEALQKNESLEAISKDSVQRDIAQTKLIGQTGNNARTAKVSRVSNQKDKGKVYSVTKMIKVSKVYNQKDKGKAALVKPHNSSKVEVSKRKSTGTTVRKTTTSAKSQRVVAVSTAGKLATAAVKSKKQLFDGKSETVNKSAKIRLVGFRGRNSSSSKRAAHA